ncbi:hypothetical protein F4810DRAFT_600418 [Camillea tinctor]|nr:hypothetical protein F4810DRAFT_600418 [Camillea tinctor]
MSSPIRPGSTPFRLTPRLYFAYGSNLSTAQMRQRCPESEPLALVHLADHEWRINERGYANIMPISPSSPPASPSPAPRQLPSLSSSPPSAPSPAPPHNANKENQIGVYGLLYDLTAADERSLDMAEGVPWAYRREFVDVTVVRVPAGREHLPPIRRARVEALADGGWRPGVVLRNVLTYVGGSGRGAPLPEYVQRMNEGIKETVEEWGMPGEYVRKVLRRDIPEV